ncbi:MAG: amidohydrolase family protein [Chloroflexi bacterium]|nr:amidohydrolase family protein [Chloroflexota bacterium]
MLFPVKPVDREFYAEHLAGFLPRRLMDIHTHVWLDSFLQPADRETRGARWPRLVARDNSIDDLLETFRLMLPQHQVTPLIFSATRADVILEQSNHYVSQVARQHRLPALLVSKPEWSAEQIAQRVREGGMLGLKPYLNFAPAHIPTAQITIFDFLPRHHLEIANAQGWIVMLHVPRPQRLKDPLNLQHLLEIEKNYPNVKLIVAHIGRAYCPEDVGNAFEILRNTARMNFDFSANTNAEIMAQLIRAVGPKRVLFGSDMPILRMRTRRICENGKYINLVPPGLYGDVSDDPNLRAVGQAEGEQLSFFLYEELLAMCRAAKMTNLDASDLNDIFYHNAARLIGFDPGFHHEEN